MPIASAVVVPVRPEEKEDLARRLAGVEGVEVSGVGDRGVAVVLEGGSVADLKKVSKSISAWEEVVDFQLAYLNWEDLEDDIA